MFQFEKQSCYSAFPNRNNAGFLDGHICVVDFASDRDRYCPLTVQRNSVSGSGSIARLILVTLDRLADPRRKSQKRHSFAGEFGRLGFGKLANQLSEKSVFESAASFRRTVKNPAVNFESELKNVPITPGKARREIN